MTTGVDKLRSLGERLRMVRIQRNELQITFSARIGVSVPTLRKMESGEPGVHIGQWVKALDVLDRLEDLDALLAVKMDLFEKYDAQHRPQRKRASRKMA